VTIRIGSPSYVRATDPEAGYPEVSGDSLSPFRQMLG
jgi:hypothetical protein